MDYLEREYAGKLLANAHLKLRSKEMAAAVGGYSAGGGSRGRQHSARARNKVGVQLNAGGDQEAQTKL